MQQALLTVTEAAERARVHPVTLRKLIRAGTGPVTTTIGRKNLIRTDRFEAWIDARTQREPDQAAAA